MGGERIKEWMNFFRGDGGLSATVKPQALRKYGSRELEVITGFLDVGVNKSKWIAHSDHHVILIKFSVFKLYASIGETEYEAMYSGKGEEVATFGGLGKPSTEEIIEFFRFKVKEEKIVEFSY